MNLTSNILSEYRRAGTEHMTAGMAWYVDAHNHAKAMGDVTMASGVIAALSPNMPWDRNLRLAYAAMDAGTITGGTFGNSIAKAQRILNGEPPLDVLGGFKVRSFFGNIVDPTDTAIVTIDRHAYDIAVNVRNGKDSRPLGTVKQYTLYSDAYREAGRLLGIMPWQVQAVTWESWRSRLTARRDTKS